MSFSQSQRGTNIGTFPPQPPSYPHLVAGSDSSNIFVPSASVPSVPSRPPYPHIRSCILCRQRKIKCDREQPCSNCDRAGHECIFPPGPGRAPKRPRANRDHRLLERLWRLESIVRRLGIELNAADGNPNAGIRNFNLDGAVNSRGLQADSSVEQEFGRLLIDETKSCYVGNRLWASLGDEIEELRDLLHQPLSEDMEHNCWRPFGEDQPHPGPEVSFFGYRALAHSLRAFHPNFSQLVLLLQIFKERVAPLVRIFHVPSMVQMFWNAVASLDTIDKDTEALMFSIYYAAIISLTPEQCQSQLGEPRFIALAKYRFVVEQALARANLLNTQSVILIQAAVLFLSALRNEDDSRAVWSMTALVFHLAQAIGLHRDGTIFGLKPFETEIRRRIWWHICLLDARSSEDHGCEPIVHDAAFDTQLPLNVNDCDLSPEMTEFAEEKEGATGMTFCLIRCQVARTMRRIGYVPPSMEGPGHSRGTQPAENRPRLMWELRQLLEDRYLRHCDSSIPIFLASATVTRLIIARMWLAVHHPMRNRDHIPSDVRDRLFQASTEVLELSSLLLTDPALLKWNWYFRTHIQWHAVAFVLSEICSRPPSSSCDRAWFNVTLLYDRCDAEEKDRKGKLSRPISRLMSKARQVREIQQAKARSLVVSGSSGSASPATNTVCTYLKPEQGLPSSVREDAPISPVESLLDFPSDPLFGTLDPFIWTPSPLAGSDITDSSQPPCF